MSLFPLRNLVWILIFLASPSVSLATQIIPTSTRMVSLGDTLEYDTLRPEGRLLFYKSPHGNLSFVSKDEPPVSIKSIRSKIFLLNGDPKSLKFLKITEKETLFGFESKNGQLHFFSTRGGYLSLTPGKNTAKQKVVSWLNILSIEGAKQ